MSKCLVFSVGIDSCEVQTFRAGGKGGQHQNKTDSGVRVIHHPSGARGESREERSQLQNKQSAFRRMAETETFQRWVRAQALKLRPVDEIVDEQMNERNLRVEVRDVSGKWAVA